MTEGQAYLNVEEEMNFRVTVNKTGRPLGVSGSNNKSARSIKFSHRPNQHMLQSP